MKLLIVTQAVDDGDPVLGFFVRWVEELAKHAQQIEVICLKEGTHRLPANVRMYSLGKPASRFWYIWNFYKYIFSLKYDAVFVHMNQEYVLLGGLFWRLWDKKVFLWRNHAHGDAGTRLAIFFSHKVFYTSSQSFTARFKKALKMPVGIDTDFFTPDPLVSKKMNSILFLGRIAPVKKVEEFVEALSELQKLGVTFSATIAGAALPKDAEYEKTIRDSVSAHGLDEKVRFAGPVTREQARALYREHALYVNLTPSGSMDKTILEAMACGTPPLVFNPDLTEELETDLVTDTLDAHALALLMRRTVGVSVRADLRDIVVQRHSLTLLMNRLDSVLRSV